jgi:hypothetical protein
MYVFGAVGSTFSVFLIEHWFMYDYSRFQCKLNRESLFFPLFRSIMSFSAVLSPFPFLPYDRQ